jgi:hypothetical protein
LADKGSLDKLLGLANLGYVAGVDGLYPCLASEHVLELEDGKN